MHRSFLFVEVRVSFEMITMEMIMIIPWMIWLYLIENISIWIVKYNYLLFLFGAVVDVWIMIWWVKGFVHFLFFVVNAFIEIIILGLIGSIDLMKIVYWFFRFWLISLLMKIWALIWTLLVLFALLTYRICFILLLLFNGFLRWYK